MHFTDQEPLEGAKEIQELGKDTKEKTQEPESANTLDLEILEIKTKFIERSGDYVHFSLRVKARCTDSKFKGKARVRLRSLDRNGFELDTETATGKILPGQSVILSDKCMMKYKFYKQIANWEVTSIDIDQD